MLPASDYKKFVKASGSSSSHADSVQSKYYISGEEARRIYLNVVKDAYTAGEKATRPTSFQDEHFVAKKGTQKTAHISKKDLFLAAQSNDVNTVRQGVNGNPEMLNAIDKFGWSLLMIACQANSAQVVEELLNLGADVSVRDKAGNSARSLVIKNKNIQMADLLLKSKSKEDKPKTEKLKKKKRKLQDPNYTCEICGNTFLDKEQHLISTVHNINASKGKKVPPCYKLPETNKGFQIMLKTGWDKGTGLGYDGSGIQYPIRAVQKKDRKGLGHKDSKTTISETNDEDKIKQKSKKILQIEDRRNKNLERNFRREFY